MDKNLKKSRTRRCPKPFPVKNHTKCYESNLKPLSNLQAAKASRVWPEKNLDTSCYLCFKCRLYIQKHKEEVVPPAGVAASVEDDGEATDETEVDRTEVPLEKTSESSHIDSQINSDASSLSMMSYDFSNLDLHEQSSECSLADLNYLLKMLHLPELKEFQVSTSRKYIVQSRYQSALNSVTKAFEGVAASYGIEIHRTNEACDDCENLLLSMKQRYSHLKSKELRYLMLTCAPKSLSAQKLEQKTGCSSHEARVAHDLRHEKELNAFLTPHWKSSAHPLADDLKQSIFAFYMRDSNSRPSPNKRDVHRVLNGSTQAFELKAKRWILVNLQELYQLYRAEFPACKVHITTFANQRPVWCIWPGRYGHSISCTCVPHENFRNRLSAMKFQGSIHEFISQYVCENPQRDCYMGMCATCPMLEEIMEIDLPDEVTTYEQWQNSNRSMTKVLVQQTAEEFLQALQEEFPAFLTHYYVTKEQQRFIDDLKSQLTANEMIVQVDFAENYAFNVQSAPTSFHWNNAQATIHPFCVNYRVAETIIAKTYIVVSDCLDHSAASFHWFQTLFYKCIRSEAWFGDITRVHYVSDGAGSQYKNKFNFRNLQSHYEDFGIHADWNFFASAHGKGPCDAASGSVKATAHRAALKGRTILSPLELFEFFDEKMKTPLRHFIYAENSKFDIFRAQLYDRFTNIETVVGTRKFHSIRASPTGLQFRFLATDAEFINIDLISAKNANVAKRAYQKGDFIVLKSGKSFVLGQIVDFLDDDQCFEVKIMRRGGTKNSFFWADVQTSLMAAPHEIIFRADPPVPVGRRPRYSKMCDQDYEKACTL